MSNSFSFVHVNPSELPYMREDKIKREVSFLENKRSGLIRKIRSENDKGIIARHREQVALVENEICYLQREIHVRENRRKAHAVFLQKRSNNRARRP